MDKKGDITWKLLVTFRGHFCPLEVLFIEVLFMGDIFWTFLGDLLWHFLGELLWPFIKQLTNPNLTSLNPIVGEGGFARTPPQCYQPPLWGGCTNQSQISWLFPIWSLLSSCKLFFYFFCNFYQKNAVKILFQHKKEPFFDKNGQKHCFLTNIGIFCFNYVISMLWEIFWGALHVCT